MVVSENTLLHSANAKNYRTVDSGEGSDELNEDLLSSDDEAISEDEEDDISSNITLFQRVWKHTTNAFMVIANVENLWDAEEVPNTVRRRNHLIVLFWFVLLASAYTTERCSFKLLVDNAGPFRLFAVEVVTACHALILGIALVLSSLFGKRHNFSLGLSLVDVFLVALVDTFSLVTVFLTGLRVPPTDVVILLQAQLPLCCFLTQLVHRDGYFTRLVKWYKQCVQGRSPADMNSLVHSQMNGLMDGSINGNQNVLGFAGLERQHVYGSLIISLAVLLALVPAFYAMIDPVAFYYADPIPVRTALHSLLYVGSCIAAAACTLYKEHLFQKAKQPVHMDKLNMVLSIFQFIIASILAPLVFGLQGLGAPGDWTKLYPSSDFGENFSDGMLCFTGRLSDDDQQTKYPEESFCDHAAELVFVHVLSIVVIGLAVDKIVNAGATKVMYRGISAGIIASVILMHIYDLREPDFNYGASVDMLNLVSLTTLILGSEVYHRGNLLPESTFETEHQPIGNIYRP